MSAVAALLNGNTNTNDDSVEQLQKQIEILKKVIHDKNIQLNMVIKHAEEKYHDIHTNYRDLANQLHDSWKNKYNKLEAENNRLMDTLTNLVKQNKTDKLIEVDGQSNDSENEHDVTSPISHIPIKNIAESLDLNDDELNQLTGGINNTDNNDNNNNNNGNTVKNKDNESGNDKEKKSKTKKRVIEAYID